MDYKFKGYRYVKPLGVIKMGATAYKILHLRIRVQVNPRINLHNYRAPVLIQNSPMLFIRTIDTVLCIHNGLVNGRGSLSTYFNQIESIYVAGQHVTVFNPICITVYIENAQYSSCVLY